MERQKLTDAVALNINSQQARYIDELIDLGYAQNAAGVARYLIQRGIDDLLRASILTKPTKNII